MDRGERMQRKGRTPADIRMRLMVGERVLIAVAFVADIVTKARAPRDARAIKEI